MWFYVFFFKQNTAYDMRISDWSSDVCSSDLEGTGEQVLRPQRVQGADLAQGVPDQERRHHGHRARQHHGAEQQREQHTAEAEAVVADRQSVVEGKSAAVRVDLGGRRNMKKKTDRTQIRY